MTQILLGINMETTYFYQASLHAVTKCICTVYALLSFPKLYYVQTSIYSLQSYVLLNTKLRNDANYKLVTHIKKNPSLGESQKTKCNPINDTCTFNIVFHNLSCVVNLYSMAFWLIYF